MDMYCCGPGQIDPDDKMHLNFNTEIKPKLTDWETIQNKPTTLEGYGITDAAKATDIPKPSSTSPKMSGIATVGKETAFARGDHVHPSDATKANADEVYKKTETYSRTEIDEKGFLTEHQDISGKADKATTLAGYGITDAYTKTELDGKLSSTYKPGGNMLFANLPQPNANNLGLVYSMMDAFTTDDRFIASEPTPYPIGTNVVCVQIMIEDTPTYLYDVLSGFVDLSDYPTKPEVASQLETKQNKITGQAGQYVGFDTGGNAVPRPAPVMVTSFNGRTGAIVPQAEDYPLTLIGAADRTLSNLSNYQKALRNIGGRPNRNLLDNWYFPQAVNQRGDTSWNGFGYHLDRWYEEKSVAGSISAAGYHVRNAQTVIQRVEAKKLDQILGKTITVSCLLSDGRFATRTGTLPKTIGTENFGIESSFGDGILFSATFFPRAKSYQFGRIVNNSGGEVVVVACKTELGPTQTLAYQDEDGNWQLFETPSFAEEMAKCQRYLMDITPSLVFNPAYFGQTYEGGAVFLVPTPVTMRIEPSVICNPDKIQIALNNGTFPVPTAVSVLLHTQGGVMIRCTVDMSGIAAFSPCDFRSSDITSKILLSAEL